MFPRSTQAPCRLTARRRLALGGLVATGALAAGAFVSTPAFADASPTIVTSMAGLSMAVGNPAVQQIQLGASLSPASNVYADLEATTSKTLDLNGFDLDVDHVGITGAGTTFTVEDTSVAPDGSSSSTSTLTISGDRVPNAQSADPVTGVLLGDGTTFHVASGTVSASSSEGGAGIGSDGDGSASFVADGSASVMAYGYDNEDNGHGGAGIGGAFGENGIHVTVADSAQVSAYGGDGAAGVGGGYGGDGGQVTITGGSLQATQDDGDAGTSTVAFPASSVGGGQGSTSARGFGGLGIERGGALELDGDTPLEIPSGATVENAGSIDLTDEDGSAAKEVLEQARSTTSAPSTPRGST